MNTVNIPLIVEIDLDDWAREYGLERIAVREDIRRTAALVFQDWLRESAGHRAASVRVGTV